MSTPPITTSEVAARHAGLIRFLLTLTSLFFLGTLTIIYFNGTGAPEPTCRIELDWGQNYEGALATVSGANLHEPLTIILSKKHRSLAVFFVEPGVYSLKVILPNSKQVIEESVSIAKGDVWSCNLSQLSHSDAKPAS